MVQKFNQIGQKHVLSEKSEKGQNQRITRHCDQGFESILYVIRWMFWEIAATEQSSFQQIAAIAAR